MRNLTLVLFAVVGVIASLPFILTSCDTGIEAQNVLNPSTVTVDDLSTILESMPVADVKAAVSQLNPDIQALIGVHALNSIPNKVAFDTGKLLEGEVRDGASSALLDDLINECLTEIPILVSGNLTGAEMEELVKSPCFTNVRRKFRDLNQVYSVVLEDALAKQYDLAPLK